MWYFHDGNSTTRLAQGWCRIYNSSLYLKQSCGWFLGCWGYIVFTAYTWPHLPICRSHRLGRNPQPPYGLSWLLTQQSGTLLELKPKKKKAPISLVTSPWISEAKVAKGSWSEGHLIWRNLIVCQRLADTCLPCNAYLSLLWSILFPLSVVGLKLSARFRVEVSICNCMHEIAWELNSVKWYRTRMRIWENPF